MDKEDIAAFTGVFFPSEPFPEREILDVNGLGGPFPVRQRNHDFSSCLTPRRSLLESILEQTGTFLVIVG